MHGMAPSFSQIAVLHGMLSYQNSDIFLFSSKLHKDIPFLISLFEYICSMCSSPCCSQYHAFSVLLSWLKTCEKYLPKVLHSKPEAIFSSGTSFVVTKTLCLLESNLESPVKGVTTFVKECYRLLIHLSQSEGELLNRQDFDMVNFLLDQTMKLSWQIKGKYVILSVLLQFVDYKKYLTNYPEVPMAVVINMKAGYASSAVSEVYKSIVSVIRNTNPSEDVILNEWGRWWKKPILDSLNSENKSLVQNVVNLILPWTMKAIPKSYEFLLESETQVFAQLILQRVAKESGVHSLQEKEIKILMTHLHHYEIRIRAEILSTLCCSSKKSEAVSEEELNILKDFILVNLNIDSTSFQQLLLAQMRTLLVRIRDSLVQQYRLMPKDNPGICFGHSEIEFVDWLFKTSVKNTHPGACFQRRRVSLLLIDTIFDVFVVSVLGGKRKEKPSKKFGDIVKIAQSHNLWLFLKDDSLLNILPCLTDFTDEIRTIAFYLLVNFTKWPLVENESPIFKPQFILNHARDLCNHPDYRNNDAGSHLYCLYFKKFYVNDENVVNSNEYCSALDFLNEIIESTKEQLKYSKENFLDAAASKPIHGLLLALEYCLSSFNRVVFKLFQSEKNRTLNFLYDILNLCDDIMQSMLLVMKRGDDKENCPSFLDIGQALENVIILQRDKTQSNLAIVDQEEILEKPTTAEVELVLSCCWHSIKNSCSLLCEVSTYFCCLELETFQKLNHLKRIAEIFSSILISSRHRGVVDACSLALNKFCVQLLKEEKLHDEICKYLLSMVFESLSGASSTSVTRRSAGLPSLCLAVVSSEKSNINRRLLPYIINALLKTVSLPLPSDTEISDKTDLPQAHAYHILKALVMEASLSQAILLHLDSLIPACVSGFSSTLWPVRNGALQLFGVLLPRICGQKKVAEDDSEYNMVSASELFSRCPRLEMYLLQQLEKCVKLHKQGKLSSELIPILSIIVKLNPPQEENWTLFVELKSLMLELLGIPVWKIRDLVSSILSVVITIEDVSELCKNIKLSLEQGNIKCNFIHGILWTVEKFFKRNNLLAGSDTEIIDHLKLLYRVITKVQVPILNAQMLSIFIILNQSNSYCSLLEIVKETQGYEEENYFKVGRVLCDKNLTWCRLKSLHLDELPLFISQLTNVDLFIQIECLHFLSSKLFPRDKKDLFSLKESLQGIFVCVASFVQKENHYSVVLEALKLIILMCEDWRIGKLILNSEATEALEKSLIYFLETKSSLSVVATSLTAWSFIIRFHIEENNVSRHSLSSWIKHFHSFCHARSPDLLRMQAAHSVTALGITLDNHLIQMLKTDHETASSLLINLCEGCLLLLQDEDEDIRNKACFFPSNLQHKYPITSLQFNVCINIILEHMFECLSFHDYFLKYLWNRLQNYPSFVKILRGAEKSVKTNLFEQEYVNVYAEPLQLLLKHRDLFLKAMKSLHDKDYKAWTDNVQLFLFDTKTELQDLVQFLSENDFSKLNQRFAFPHQVFLAFKKMYSVIEVLMSCEDMISSSSSLAVLREAILCQWKSVEAILTPINHWFLIQL
ncbi:tRNA (32-2'-O)-methyltransferase regulator THADA isoform X2 [Parasteatoda tepidariorum]